MNEESQVTGCYNITFNYTNQKTVRLSPESDAQAAAQTDNLLLQGHWGKEDAVDPAHKF